MTIANTLIDRFEPQLSSLLGAVRRAERFLGPEDDWVEDDRRIVYEAAQPILGRVGRDTTREKGTADYITTAHATPDAVECVLHDNNYQRNLLSTRKYRTDHDGGQQWAVGSWVLDPADTDWQHHVYLFESPGGGCDVYGHFETSVRDPHGHVTDEQTHGDPRGFVRVSLDDSGLEHGSRSI